MKIIGIDPGNTDTALTIWDITNKKITYKLLSNNEEILAALNSFDKKEHILAIEMIASYGMPVGKEVFETCFWIGRFYQHFIEANGKAELVYRKDVKLGLCGTTRAKDGNVRQVVIDRLGKPGTKKNPGVTYGITADLWQSLALCLFCDDKMNVK